MQNNRRGRYTLDSKWSSISYGFESDTMIGVFLSVEGNRLAILEDKSVDVSIKPARFETISEDEDSVELHTGEVGLGRRVSEELMRKYLARYGVSTERIDELFQRIKK